jgi:hypothetical protein
MIPTILIASILGLLVVLPTSLIYASGPRFDSPEDRPQEYRDCYRDGWEQGFAGMYDSDRASECYETGLDWYNKIWNDACTQTRSEDDCNDKRNDPVDVQENNEELGEQNRRYCYDLGYEDGQDHPFNRDLYEGCLDYVDTYYPGFIDGCMDVAGNTREICETFTDS